MKTKEKEYMDYLKIVSPFYKSQEDMNFFVSLIESKKHELQKSIEVNEEIRSLELIAEKLDKEGKSNEKYWLASYYFYNKIAEKLDNSERITYIYIARAYKVYLKFLNYLYFKGDDNFFTAYSNIKKELNGFVEKIKKNFTDDEELEKLIVSYYKFSIRYAIQHRQFDLSYKLIKEAERYLKCNELLNYYKTEILFYNNPKDYRINDFLNNGFSSFPKNLDFKKAIDLIPACLRIQFLQGKILKELGKFEEAKNKFASNIAIFLDSFSLHSIKYILNLIEEEKILNRISNNGKSTKEFFDYLELCLQKNQKILSILNNVFNYSEDKKLKSLLDAIDSTSLFEEILYPSTSQTLYKQCMDIIGSRRLEKIYALKSLLIHYKELLERRIKYFSKRAVVYESIAHYLDHSVLELAQLLQRKDQNRNISKICFDELKKNQANKMVEFLAKAYQSSDSFDYSKFDKILSLHPILQRLIA